MLRVLPLFLLARFMTCHLLHPPFAPQAASLNLPPLKRMSTRCGIFPSHLMSSRLISSHLISCPSTLPPTISAQRRHLPHCHQRLSILRAHVTSPIASHLFSPLLRHPGCSPDAFTYNTVINVYGREGQMEEAEAVLQQMRARGCIPDRVSPQRVRNF